MWIKRAYKIYRLKQKQMGLLYYLPIGTVLVVLPLSFFCFFREEAGIYTLETYKKLLGITQTVIPFLSVFWLLFQLEEWLEIRKRELYGFVYKKPILTGFFYSGYFDLLLLPVYLFYDYYLRGYFYEYFRIICICTFFQGAVLFLMFLTKSNMITVLWVILYILFCTGTEKGGVVSYVAGMPADRVRDYCHSGIFLVMGMGLFLMAGWAKNSKGCIG